MQGWALIRCYLWNYWEKKTWVGGLGAYIRAWALRDHTVHCFRYMISTIFLLLSSNTEMKMYGHVTPNQTQILKIFLLYISIFIIFIHHNSSFHIKKVHYIIIKQISNKNNKTDTILLCHTHSQILQVNTTVVNTGTNSDTNLWELHWASVDPMQSSIGGAVTWSISDHRTS